MNNFFRLRPRLEKRASEVLGGGLSYWIGLGSSILLLATGIVVGLASGQRLDCWIALLFLGATLSFGVSVLLLKRRLLSQSEVLDAEMRRRLEGEEKLRHREATLRLIFDGINDGILLHAMDGRVIDVNETMLAMFGVNREEALTFGIEDYSSPRNSLDDLPRRWSLVQMGLHQFFPWKAKKPLTGEEFDVEVYLSKISLPEEETAILATIRDVSDRKKTEEALLRAESAYRTIFENAMDAIFETHVSGRFTRANPATARLLGYESPGELMRSVSHVGKQLYADPEQRTQLLKLLTEQGSVQNYEMRFRRKDGSLRWASLSARANFDAQGNLVTIDAVVQDATQRKLSEAELQERANLDDLTGLANRFLFKQHLRTVHTQAKRSGKKYAVLFIDLDGFKEVNDSYGHLMGDELLIQTGNRLRERFRETDLVARLGGDEFAALLWDVKDRQSVIRLGQELIEALSQAYTLDDTVEVVVSGSIGASIYPRDGEVSELLVERADQAMYSAKQGGKNRFCFFDQTGDQSGDCP